MRTTIDLPDDLHRIATSISTANRTTLSATVAALMRAGLGRGAAQAEVTVSPRTGLPVTSVGRPVTIEDVWALDDEQ